MLDTAGSRASCLAG